MKEDQQAIADNNNKIRLTIIIIMDDNGVEESNRCEDLEKERKRPK